MSSAQGQWLPTPFDTSGGERDLPAESKTTTYTTASTNKRTGSPSLENSVPPKRFQPEYVERPAAAHLSTPQRTALDTSSRTPIRNESNQRLNDYSSGGLPLQISGIRFEQPNPHEHPEIDFKYPFPEYSGMVCQGSQFRSSHEDFGLMETTMPQMPPPSHQLQQGWNDFEDLNVAIPQNPTRHHRESENTPRYHQSFQRQEAKNSSKGYRSGGGRRHNVIDLTSPIGGRGFYQVTAADLATPIPSPYQAHYLPSNQNYSRGNNGDYDQNKSKTHRLACNQELSFEVGGEPYDRWKESPVQGPLGPAFSNPGRQGRASSRDPEQMQSPAHPRQQISYSYSDMDHSIPQKISSTRRETTNQNRMHRGPPQTLNTVEDQTLVQMMRRSKPAPGPQDRRPTTREHLSAEELNNPNMRHTASAFEAWSDSCSTKRSTAKDFKYVQKAREDDIKTQQSAAEKIMERAQQGKELESYDDIFEESPLAKASEARIQKSIEEDSQRKYRKEEALLAKALKDQYAEQLADFRKKIELEEQEARRAQRKAKITEEEKRLARVKETERIEKKRLAAEEVLERARVQRQEAALDETLKKLEVERGAAKKQATSLRPVRRTGLGSQNLTHKIDDHKASSDSCMFIISDDDDDDLPPVNAIGKPNRREAKDGNGKKLNEGEKVATPAEATVIVVEDISMAAIASDDRRRAPPARQRRRSSPTPRTRPRGGWDASTEQRKSDMLLKRVQRELEKSNADRKAFDKAYKRDWQERLTQLDEVKKALETLVETTRQPVGRAAVLSHGSPCGHDARLGPVNSAKKPAALTSQIKFVAQVESEAKEREDFEKAERERNEKARRAYYRRIEHEIRRVLASQGIEIDEEKVKMTIDERMVAWEEKKRKREHKSKTNNGSPSATLDTTEIALLPQATSASTGETAETQQNQKELLAKKREEGIRAGLNFLRAKNLAGGGFDIAASRSNIQELESEESEEDPDDDDNDEPEAPSELVTNALDSIAEKYNTLSVQVPSDEPSDEIVHPISSIPDAASTSAVSGTVSLPAIINPIESDMIYIYNVNQRSERGDKWFETLVLASFHDLDEANTFAQQKTGELIYNPVLSQVGQDMTYDDQNRFMGRAINNKDENHAELVWVSQVITYIGDVSNLSFNDLKPTRPCQVYNVLQTKCQKYADKKDASPESEVIATTTVKTLANQKAVELFLTLSKPLKPNIDLVQNYYNITIPSVRANLADINEKDGCVSLEGEDEESGRWFKVEVFECKVVGPKN